MNTMINLTKKPTNLFTPNPFNIFKLLSYYSDIDQSNSFLKMENKPVIDIIELFNMDKNGNRIFDYNEDTVLIREKNICLTNEEKVDKKLYFVKGVKLARPRNEINIMYCNPLSFLYMENHGASSAQLGIIIIFIDIIIEDFSRLFSIIKHDKIDEFIDGLKNIDIIEVQNMAKAVHDISLLIEYVYESNYDYGFYGQFDFEKKLETQYKLNDIIAARMLVIFFANHANNPNFRNIIKSAIASIAVLDKIEDVLFNNEYDIINNIENLDKPLPEDIIKKLYSKIKRDEDIHKEYMVSNDVVTDIIFDVMDNDFFNKGYHDQIMSILSYMKSKNMLIYQSL